MESSLLLDVYEEFLQSGKDVRFSPEAYGFILSSLDYYRSKTSVEGHIKAEKLVYAVLELAKMKFGPLAKEVLNSWGVEKADHIGVIVYNLIDMKILTKSEEDNISEFFIDNVFEEELGKSYNPYRIDKKNIKIFKDAWHQFQIVLY